ncbi:Excinuclease ABC, C subunit [Prunus dulcis]|uniref:Excinuclease ABC, C subunit n=1 Tax=Prunus dulcis TaxID=3755 RepID=A0A4Y1QMG1_PRUDU|nr:Excinuclease ABC, C subunit [Prunus dulcis]
MVLIDINWKFGTFFLMFPLELCSLNGPGSTQLYRRRLGRLLQALNHWAALARKIKLAYTMLTLPPWQSLNITVKFFSTQYTKHSAGCPRLPEQMKVKVCSMDELPSCTKPSDDLLENEDEWCHERECDEDMNSSTLPEETLLDFRTHIQQMISRVIVALE